MVEWIVEFYFKMVDGEEVEMNGFGIMIMGSCMQLEFYIENKMVLVSFEFVWFDGFELFELFFDFEI